MHKPFITSTNGVGWISIEPPLGLTPQDEADIVAFLKTLTDGYDKPLNGFIFPPFP